MKHIIALPEQVDLEVDLASVGSRSLALLIDLLIGGLILFVPYALVFLTARDATQSWLGQFGVSTITLVFLLLLFSFQWGYFNFFEWLWNGQSPGKRIMRLRVIRLNGSPISWSDVFLRNLIRPLDTFVSLGLIGVGMIFVSRRSQRLGDLMAQTLVIRETSQNWSLIDSVSIPDHSAMAKLPPSPVVLPLHPWELLQSYSARSAHLNPNLRTRIGAKLREALIPFVDDADLPRAGISDNDWLCELASRATTKRTR